MIRYFFFSSRRRHTRYWRDWSSDVCSSDLFRLACGLTIFLFGESTFLFENFKKDQKLGEIRDEYFLFFRSFSQSFFYKGLCDGSFLSFSSDLRRKTFERKNVIFFCMDFTDPASDRTLESFFSSFLYGHFDNLLYFSSI